MLFPENSRIREVSRISGAGDSSAPELLESLLTVGLSNNSGGGGGGVSKSTTRTDPIFLTASEQNHTVRVRVHQLWNVELLLKTSLKICI